MKNVNITPPNKMHNLLKKLETYKIQNNPKRYSVDKISGKNSINLYQEHENFLRRNSYQKPTLNNVNSQALQTLSDAALKVKNLLSDFLVNADPDDKQKFNIEEELNEIKKNKNENLNLYTIIGDNSGKSSNNDSGSDIGNMNNFIKKEIKNKKRKSDLGKRNSMLLSFNDDDFKNYSRGISYKKPKIKNLNIYSMDNTNEDTLNAINKIRSLKENIKRNSKISLRKKIYSNDNLFLLNKRLSSNDNLINLNKRKGSGFSFGKVSGNSSNSIKRKSTDDKLFIFNRKSSDNILNFTKRFSEKNIKQNLNSFNNFNNHNINNINNELKSSFLKKKNK